MATYPVINKETGEQKEVSMSVHDWDQWKENNPDWQRYFTPENSPSLGIELGEFSGVKYRCQSGLFSFH
jgi:hypothetical protein